MFNGSGGFFCLWWWLSFLFNVSGGFFVNCDGWVFCLWQWLSFCVNGGSCAFCLMVVIEFFVYGSG